MTGESFRFLHASDLRLEQTPYGLTDVPDHLRELLIESPLQSAARVFETAVVDDVDFVVLSGDILDLENAGPYEISFLLDQLQLLDDQRIHVYWAGSVRDRLDRWPEDIPLPDTTHLFPKGKAHTFTHRRHDVPVADVIGVSADQGSQVEVGNYRTDPTNRFTVAVGHGRADASALAAHKHIDYWALGGEDKSRTLFQSQQMGQYCGSPQGRCPSEDGPHGCTLVQVDRGRKARPKFLATDVVRWRNESLELGDATQRNELQRQLRSRMQRIASEASGNTVLVSWAIEAEGPLAGMLRGGQLDQELLEWLRTEFGNAKPAVWTIGLKANSSADLPEDLFEEDTILGDFLRAVREHERDGSLPLDFAHFIPDAGSNRALVSALHTVDAPSRQLLLEEAAALGAELLRGEDVL
jgi:DNA repair exonuclease SbcCD nuclease subunit